MRFGSLFSGIGGLDLGLERAGMECAWQIENDSYAVRVLTKHWPEVPKYGDIRRVNFVPLKGVGLLAGGFPCQDLSYAGKGLGLSGARSGLWSEFKRAVCVVRPRFVLVENVPGLLSRGMGAVLGDLARLGYDCEWQSLPAAAFGAPHLRWRVFVIAYARSVEHEGDCDALGGTRAPELLAADTAGSRRRTGRAGRPLGSGAGLRVEAVQPLADSEGERCGEAGRDSERSTEWLTGSGEILAHPESAVWRRPNGAHDTGRRHPEARGRREPRDWAEHWRVEPDVGRVANGIPRRVDRLRGLGNAVLPQIGEYLGGLILEHRRAA